MAKGRQRQKGPTLSTGGAAQGAAPPALKNLSPQMQQAWKHFEAGDKVAARREARAVLSANPSEQDAQQANELLGRLELPKIAVILGGVAGVVILLLIALAVSRY